MGAQKMKNKEIKISPFNSSLETGTRTLALLEAVYPKTLDLQRLVEFDYLAVHSGDADGPESLHAPLPLRTGEMLVRRKVIESGLSLMMSRNLVKQLPSSEGIRYLATDATSPFLSALISPYINKLRERAKWVANELGNASDDELHELTRNLFDKWTAQFAPFEEITRGTI